MHTVCFLSCRITRMQLSQEHTHLHGVCARRCFLVVRSTQQTAHLPTHCYLHSLPSEPLVQEGATVQLHGILHSARGRFPQTRSYEQQRVAKRLKRQACHW
jgi:hypothetical protein